jgi:hypothetical protein
MMTNQEHKALVERFLYRMAWPASRLSDEEKGTIADQMAWLAAEEVPCTEHLRAAFEAGLESEGTGKPLDFEDWLLVTDQEQDIEALHRRQERYRKSREEGDYAAREGPQPGEANVIVTDEDGTHVQSIEDTERPEVDPVVLQRAAAQLPEGLCRVCGNLTLEKFDDVWICIAHKQHFIEWLEKAVQDTERPDEGDAL